MREGELPLPQTPPVLMGIFVAGATSGATGIAFPLSRRLGSSRWKFPVAGHRRLPRERVPEPPIHSSGSSIRCVSQFTLAEATAS